MLLSLFPSPSVLKSVLYICFSIAALQISSLVLSSYTPYICISICYFSSNLRYADDTTLMAESEEELKNPLDESERGE